PVSSPEQIPTLVGGDGRLPASPEGLMRAQLRDVLVEARAQLQRFRKLLGRDPTHLASHLHVHHLAVVLQAVITLAWETGLPVRSLSSEMRTRLRRERIATIDHEVDEFEGGRATVEDL